MSNMTLPEAAAKLNPHEKEKAREHLYGGVTPEPPGTRIDLWFPEKTGLSCIEIHGHAPQEGDKFLINIHSFDPDDNSNFNGRNEWRVKKVVYSVTAVPDLKHRLIGEVPTYKVEAFLVPYWHWRNPYWVVRGWIKRAWYAHCRRKNAKKAKS